MGTFHNLLKEKNSLFADRINDIKDRARNEWLRSLGKNDFSHSENVERNLDRLVPNHIKEGMSAGEIFVLLYGAYLHDIGYLKNKEQHPKASHDEILHNYPRYRLDDEYQAEAVAKICRGHGEEKDYPIMNIPDNFGVDSLDPYSPLNLRFLTALLRLADDLDNAYTRVLGRVEQKESLRDLVRFVEIEPDRWIICFQCKPQTSREWKELDGMRRYTQERLDEIKLILENKGLRYRKIEIFPEENPYSEEEAQRSDAAFCKKVYAIFKLQGRYENLKNNVNFAGEIIDIYGEYPLPEGDIMKTVIQCYQEVDEGTVNRFIGLIETLRDIDRGILVSEREINFEILNYAKKKKVAVRTINELLMGLVDVEHYLDWVIKNYKGDEVSDYYVDLSCKRRGKGKVEVFPSIHTYVDVWQTTGEKNYISLLGEYGSGKTSFCKKYAYDLALRYKTNRAQNRIPIFVSLKDYAKAMNIRQLITDLLTNIYGLKGMDYETFSLMNEAGMFVIIFDGFDEMAQKVDPKVIKENFEELAKTAVKNSKVLITCRIEFFRSSEQAENIFAGEWIDVTDRPNFEVVYLQEFSEEQIKEFLGKRVGEKEGEKYFQQIQNTFNLMDLAHRPILLDMIIKSFPELIGAKKIITPAEIYKVYTNYWLERDIKTKRTLLHKDDKNFFMEELAFQMHLSGRLSVHYTEMPEVIQKHFKLEKAEEIDYFSHDIMACSFLNRDGLGNYKFNHKSFMEYFTAKKFFREIQKGVKENFGRKKISREILSFLKDFTEEKKEMKKTLWEWVYLTRKEKVKYSYLGSNSITLLNMMKEDFINKDFSNTVLSNADLSHANLKNTNFRGTILKGANLNHTVLRNSNFEDADLTGVSLEETTGGAVFEVDFDPAGKFIVSGHRDNEIKVWRVQEWNLFQCLKGHHNVIRSVCYSRNGKYIASGSWDTTVKIWDAKKLTEIYTLKGHHLTIFSVRFSPDSKYVVSGSMDKSIRIWEIESGEELPPPMRHNDGVRSISLSRNGKYIASGSYDHNIKIWDFNTHEEIATLEEHSGTVWSVCFDPTGRYIVSGSSDKNIIIWDVEKREIFLKILKAHSDSVLSVCYSPNGKYIVSGSADGDRSIKVWDAKAGKKIMPLKGHSNGVFSLCFSKDEKYLISGSADATIRVWDVNSWNCLQTIKITDKLESIKMDVTGMRIKGPQGLSEDRYNWLIKHGAIDVRRR